MSYWKKNVSAESVVMVAIIALLVVGMHQGACALESSAPWFAIAKKLIFVVLLATLLILHRAYVRFNYARELGLPEVSP